MWFFLLIAVLVVILQAPAGFFLNLVLWILGGIALLFACLFLGGFVIAMFSKKDPALEIGPIDDLPPASDTKDFQGFTDAALRDSIPIAAIERRIYGLPNEKPRQALTDAQDAEDEEEEERLRRQQDQEAEDEEWWRAKREAEEEAERQWTETWDDGYDDRGREDSRY